MTRKIIQITSTGVENTIQTQCNVMFMALCDDGTVWVTSDRILWDDNPWENVKGVPQENDERGLYD